MKSSQLCSLTNRLIRFLIYSLAVLCGGSLDAGHVEDLVEQLGASTFAEREAAGLALWNIGASALPQVRQAAESSDPEVRWRAEQLLPVLEGGIRPDWSEDLRRRLLEVDTLPPEGKVALMTEVKNSKGSASLPFLINQLNGEASPTAKTLVMSIMDDGEGAETVISLLPAQPESVAGAEILAEAYLLSNPDEGGLLSLKLQYLPEHARRKIIEVTVDLLVDLYQAGDYQKMYDLATAYEDVVHQNAPLMYLKGAAAAHLGNTQEASGLCDAALQLNPEEESPHYWAGEVLGRIGQDYLAAREWMKILEIPPRGEVYDINAYNRLGAIYSRKKEYERAANAYSNSLALFRKAKEEGRGMGMIGATEEEIEHIIQDLRLKANGIDMGENPLEGTLSIVVKGIKDEDVNELKKSLTGEIRFTVQPYGFRLLETAPSTLIFDQEKEKLYLTLNGKAFGEGVPYEWREEGNLILLRTLDMRYVMELDPETREGRILKKFELDYFFHIKGNKQVHLLKNTKMVLNGEEVSWEELEEGIPMDFLPEKIEFRLEGQNESGATIKAEMNFDPRKNAPDAP